MRINYRRPLICILLAEAILLSGQLAGCGSTAPAADLKPTSTEPALPTLPPLSTGVPSGFWLEQIDSMPDAANPQTENYNLIDFDQERARTEIYYQGSLHFGAVLEGGEMLTFSTLGAESGITQASFENFVGGDSSRLGIDTLGGFSAKKVGEEVVDGKATDVYRAEFPDPSPGEIIADFALVYVERESGLRVREEWMVGSRKVRDISGRLVSPSPDLEMGLVLHPVADLRPLLGTRD